jgi:hypothetical protein
MNGVKTKICSVCERKLPATEKYFHKSKINRDGFRGKCKRCTNTANRKYRVTHKEVCQKYRDEHKGGTKEYNKQYQLGHRDVIKIQHHDWYLQNSDTIKSRIYKRYNANREEILEQNRAKNLDLKLLVFSHYGKHCAICGETRIEFLCLDHVNGGGNLLDEHGIPFYRELAKAGFPEGYRVLCWNHNLIVHLDKIQSLWKYTKSALKARSYRERIKKEVISHYGGQCSCCGCSDIRVLSIDHINRDGAKHREETGHGEKFYLWLRRNGYPTGYRVLCFNCNSGRELNDGVCPHQTVVSVPNNLVKCGCLLRC